MTNPAARESGFDQSRRDFLSTAGKVAGGVIAVEMLAPIAVLAAERRQVAVRLTEVSINQLVNPLGQTISEQRGAREGNDYVLSPTQERGRERAQRVRARIVADGTSRERVRVEKSDGSSEYRNLNSTFVFNGYKDTLAPVRDNCDDKQDSCEPELWDGMNIDVYRVRKGGALELAFTFPTAFDCNPRYQTVIDTIRTTQPGEAIQTPTSKPTEVIPSATPTPIKPPVQAPAQVPRQSYQPSLEDEFGKVAILETTQLERVIYE